MVHTFVTCRVAILVQIIHPVLETGFVGLAAQVSPVTLSYKLSIVCRTTGLRIEQCRETSNPERTRGVHAPLTRACVILVDVCAAGSSNVVCPVVEPAFIRFRPVY